MNNLIDRLSKCYASTIHDVLREKGYGNCVLPPEIQALEKLSLIHISEPTRRS